MGAYSLVDGATDDMNMKWNHLIRLICHNSILTVLSRFLAHGFLSEHVPVLEYRHTEVNRKIYNIGTPAINSQNDVFSVIGVCAKKRDYTCTLVKSLME